MPNQVGHHPGAAELGELLADDGRLGGEALEGVAPKEREEATRALVQARIDAANAHLARFETIKKFVLVEEPLTVENGMLTPTLKAKRKKIIQRYGERLASLYAQR